MLKISLDFGVCSDPLSTMALHFWLSTSTSSTEGTWRGSASYLWTEYLTPNTCEETKKNLLPRNGDTIHIIQVHVDFLEGLPQEKSPTPEELITFIECHRHIQALRALGGRCQRIRQVVDT